jgi:hypothetical protein
MPDMRITVDINDELARRVIEAAQRAGRNLDEVIADALRQYLRATITQRRKVMLPVSRGRGGLRPGVDLDNSAALLDLMESQE